MEAFLLILLPYSLLAAVLGLCIFVWQPLTWPDKLLRAFALVASAPPVLLLPWYAGRMCDIGVLLFVFGLMAAALPISTILCRPAFRRSKLRGFLTFLGCGLVVYLILWHPWNHLSIRDSPQRSTSASATARSTRSGT